MSLFRPVCYEALANLGWWLCPGAVCPYLVDGECHIVKPIDRLTFGLILQRSVVCINSGYPAFPSLSLRPCNEAIGVPVLNTVFILIEREIQLNGRNSITGIFTNPI